MPDFKIQMTEVIFDNNQMSNKFSEILVCDSIEAKLIAVNFM